MHDPLSSRGLDESYRAYIDCLNRQAWDELGSSVSETVRHDGRDLRISGYRAMIQQNYRDIPDLRYNVDMLICDAPVVAARLLFDCTPRGMFLGLQVNGRRVTFSENVFYRFAQGLIEDVWSIVDKAAIEAQLSL